MKCKTKGKFGDVTPKVDAKVYDSMLFCRATIVECNTLKGNLNTYELASGQAINLSKSEVFYSRNVSEGMRAALS